MTYDVEGAWNRAFAKNTCTHGFSMLLKRRLGNFLKLLPKTAKILDVGCGDGDKTDYISKRGYSVNAIDSSAVAINSAKKNFPRVNFSKQSVLSTNFVLGQFDAITSIAVFHCFLKKDRIKYVRELSRILKKGGLLFQLVLASYNVPQKQYVETNTYFSEKMGTAFHQFTEEELRNYFSEFEFIDIKKHKRYKMNIYTMILKKI